MLTKLISFVLVAGGLALGTVAASTAYLPRLDAVPRPAEGEPDSALTLAAPAGIDPEAGDRDTPLVQPGTRLTADVLDRLQDADPPVDRVKVKEFALGRWDLAWLFGVSVAALVAGAGLIRLDQRRAVAAMQPSGTGATAADAGGPTGAPSPPLTPRGLLENAHARIARLAAEGSGGPDRRQRVIGELDAVRTSCFEPFVELRPALLAAGGMTGYAQVMDAFAASERAFNRAWSAAADGYMTEAEECLAAGLERLAEAVQRLPG